jgi:inner membrane protein
MENFKELLTPELIWCIVGIIMLMVEFVVPGFVIFFFGIGALFVALLCFLTTSLSINAQLIIFLVSSILFLIVLRRWFKAIFRGFFGSKNKMPINKKYNVGETATVTEKITPYEKGKIEFHGSMWSAESNREIAKGTTVVITEQNNLTFKVKPIIKK